MNYDQTQEDPEDCQHPGFFFIDTRPIIMVCWQCQCAMAIDL